MKSMVYSPYPRRLECLTIYRYITNAAYSLQFFYDSECWSGLGLKIVNVILYPWGTMSSQELVWDAREFQDQIEIWKCWFLGRGWNRSTRRKTSRSRVEDQQQTQPTYEAGSRNQTWATLVGGECSVHCAISAPHKPSTSLTAVWCSTNWANQSSSILSGRGFI